MTCNHSSHRESHTLSTGQRIKKKKHNNIQLNEIEIIIIMVCNYNSCVYGRIEAPCDNYTTIVTQFFFLSRSCKSSLRCRSPFSMISRYIRVARTMCHLLAFCCCCCYFSVFIAFFFCVDFYIYIISISSFTLATIYSELKWKLICSNQRVMKKLNKLRCA